MGFQNSLCPPLSLSLAPSPSKLHTQCSSAALGEFETRVIDVFSHVCFVDERDTAAIPCIIPCGLASTHSVRPTQSVLFAASLALLL